MKNLIAVAFAALPFVLASGAFAQPCPFNEIELGTTPIKIPIENTVLDTTARQFVSLSKVPATPDQAILNVRASVNIDQLRSLFPTLVQSRVSLPGSSCQDRYWMGNYSLTGTDGNRLDGDLDVRHERWLCADTPVEVPCPTWSKPLRMCSNVVRRKLVTTTSHVDITFRAEAKSGRINIETKSDARKPTVEGSGEIGKVFVETIKSVADIGLSFSGKSVSGEVEKIFDKMAKFTNQKAISAPDALTREDLKQLKFKLTAAEFDGKAPIVLDVVYSTAPQRVNTLCFVRSKLIESKGQW